MHFSHLLSEFCSQIGGRWNSVRKGDLESLEKAKRSIGRGLTSALLTLAKDDLGTVVAATPSVTSVERFREFFPNNPLILLMRDGHSVVESGVKTFKWTYEGATHRWAGAARRIRAYVEAAAPGDRHLLVRYEDLMTDRESETKRILEFLELDADRYPFEEASDLPVRGSSDLAMSGTDKIHWNPVKADKTFDPLGRAAHWPTRLRERFDWIAGQESKHFGYQTTGPDAPGALHRVRHSVLDWVWRLGSVRNEARILARSVRTALRYRRDGADIG